MPRRPEGFSFQRMTTKNDSDTWSMEKKFEYADYITQEEVRNYALKIANTINHNQDLDEQRKILIDLLSEDTIEGLVRKNIDTISGFSDKKDTDNKAKNLDKHSHDVKKMTMDTVRMIRKQIIEELKKHIPDTLYYFIEKHIDVDANQLNKKDIISDAKGEKLFLKETKLYNAQTAAALHKSLKKLASAFATLKKPDEQMPFVRRPILIEESTVKILADRPTISYTSEDKNLTTIEDVFKDSRTDVEFSTRDALLAFTDCLRGAKFLADNGLTLTDINTRNAGKNLGIDKITKKGILFDLDGLQQANTEIETLIGPWSQSPHEVVDLYPPEYRRIIFGTRAVATTKAMIWELGSTLNTIAKKQRRMSEMNSGYKVTAIKGWDNIIKLSEKMSDEHPPNRPDFDICINEFTKIVNDYFKEEINK